MREYPFMLVDDVRGASCGWPDTRQAHRGSSLPEGGSVHRLGNGVMGADLWYHGLVGDRTDIQTVMVGGAAVAVLTL